MQVRDEIYVSRFRRLHNKNEQCRVGYKQKTLIRGF